MGLAFGIACVAFAGLVICVLIYMLDRRSNQSAWDQLIEREWNTFSEADRIEQAYQQTVRRIRTLNQDKYG